MTFGQGLLLTQLHLPTFRSQATNLPEKKKKKVFTFFPIGKPNRSRSTLGHDLYKQRLARVSDATCQDSLKPALEKILRFLPYIGMATIAVM